MTLGPHRRRHHRARWSAGMLMLSLFLALVSVPFAAASEPTPEELEAEDGGEDGPIILSDAVFPAVNAVNSTMFGMGTWLWPQGRRGFQLDVLENELVVFDLDTLEEIQRVPLSREAAWSTGAVAHAWPTPVAVDGTAGRLFVAYSADIVRNEPEALTRGEMCVRHGALACVQGVMVYNAVTLELEQTIPLQLLTADGLITSPRLLSIEYVPPVDTIGKGKVLLLIEDLSSEQEYTQMWMYPRARGGARVYAAQLDVELGAQDWLVRVQGCRSSRESTDQGTSGGAELGHPEPSGIIMKREVPGDRAIYVGCNSTGQTGVVSRIPLDEDDRPVTAAFAPQDPVGDAAEAAFGREDDQQTPDDTPNEGAAADNGTREETVRGPSQVYTFLADPVSGRILMKSNAGGSEVWWVYDADKRALVGTIGIGPYRNYNSTRAGLDRHTGRFYVLAPSAGTFSGGFFVTDLRRDPLPQALVFPQFAWLRDQAALEAGPSLVIEPGLDGRPPRIFYRLINAANQYSYRILEDGLPISVNPEATEASERRTIDLDEAEGVTSSTFDGAARGFGFRTILVGGVEAALRANSFDPGQITLVQQMLTNPDATDPQGEKGGGLDNPTVPEAGPDACKDADREVVMAFVGPVQPTVVDVGGSSAAAEPLVLNASTRRDSEQPVSRCTRARWDEVWAKALFAQAPVKEPALPWLFGDGEASCVSSDEVPEGAFADPVVGSFSSQVVCDGEEVQGWSRARGVQVEGLTVAEVWSAFHVFRDPVRGMVARVESGARGIDFEGVVKIDSVKALAESWANGRGNHGVVDPALERELGLVGAGEEGDDAANTPSIDETNCDFSRTAGTCFERSIFGVWTPGYQCGPCGDEEALIEGLNRALDPLGASARLRDPEPSLLPGAEDGYIAAILRPEIDRIPDVILNGDLLPTTLPTFEIIRDAPPGRVSNGLISTTAPPSARGRQVYQFAGVEVSSTYGIQCLLEYDPETNVCAAPVEELASLTLELRDLDGEPLAGGAFELRADGDGDGVLGLTDELLPEGACVTGPDGVGTCSFEELEPGPYIVTQVSAPPGHAATEEPFAVELFSGDQRTVTFTNGPSVSVIDIEVADEAGALLAGATFGVFPQDGGEAVATCTTDETGACRLEVEPGAYVLRQTGTPDGFQAIEDIPFEITSAGQTATVGLVLATAGSGTEPVPMPEPPPPAAGFIPFDPGPSLLPVIDAVPPPVGDAPAVVEPPPGPSIADQVGETLIRVVRAPAEAVRLFTRSPIEAASFAGVWLLLALAFLAVRKRMELVRLLN